MRDYNRNNRGGGGRSGGGRYGGGGNFRGRDSGRREMYDAVCDECGKSCKVPFRPSGDKPIYCSDCFEKKDGGGSRRPSRRDSGRPGFGGRDDSNKQLLEQMTSINSKLDRILKVLEGNVEKKPVSIELETKKPTKEVKKAVKKVVSKDKKEEKKESKKKTKKSTKKE